MSTPSVWRAAGKDGKGTTLENLMTAVMLHEGTHVAQMPSYGAEIGRLSERYHLPENFSDEASRNSSERMPSSRDRSNENRSCVLARPNAKTRARGSPLVRSALAMMRARQARWYRGKNAYLAQAEPVWLTLEGSGQWLAYSWVVDPRGGRVPAADVRPGFVNDRWWSQREGFAAFMALQRLTGTAWKRRRFTKAERRSCKCSPPPPPRKARVANPAIISSVNLSSGNLSRLPIYAKREAEPTSFRIAARRCHGFAGPLSLFSHS